VAARWIAEEDRALLRLYAADHPVTEIAIALGRSADAVTARRRQLGVPPRRPRAWSAREDALLRAALSDGVPATRVAARIDRTPDAVRRRQRTLCGHPSAPRRYQPADDEAIRRCFVRGDDVVALAQSLGRSVDAVRLRARALGVHQPARRARWRAPPKTRSCATATPRGGRQLGLPGPPPPPSPSARRCRPWSEQEDEVLRLHAGVNPATLAQLIGRSDLAVTARLRLLGLRAARERSRTTRRRAPAVSRRVSGRPSSERARRCVA
jgi:hypothetical protein